MSTLRRQVGALVRHHRKRADLTQSELAEKANKSLDMINKIESGGAAPSFDTLADLSRVLGVPVREFFGVGEFEAGASRNDPLVRLIDRVAGLGDDDIEWIDRLVGTALARKSRT